MVSSCVHYVVFGPDLLLVPRLLFACALIVLFAIDLEHHLLPNVITLPGIVVGLASAPCCRRACRALIGVLVGGGVLWLIGEAYYRYCRSGGHGRRRRQDARDDRRLPRLEARAPDARALSFLGAIIGLS